MYNVAYEKPFSVSPPAFETERMAVRRFICEIDAEMYGPIEIANILIASAESKD